MSRPSLLMRALIAERAGMNVADAELVDYVLDLREASAKDLAEAMHLSKSTITSMLDRLERTGFITREIDGADRRRIVIRPNLELIGERIRPFYVAHGKDFLELTEGYSDDELRFLTNHYERMTDLYNKQVQQLLSIEQKPK
jgi:DNA-binding MarR family transcriptional regulator